MKKLLGIAAFIAALTLSGCGCGGPDPTETPTDNPTETPTVEPTETPTETPTEDPTEVPTVDPTEDPTETPTEVPTDEPTETPTETPTEPPVVNPTLPEEPAVGTTRLYFLAPSFWHNNGENLTAVFTDADYPGTVMFEVDSNETSKLYAYDVDLTTASYIGFTLSLDNDHLGGDTLRFADVYTDTTTINVADLGSNNLFSLIDEELVTTRSSYLFATEYVPGQWDYEKPSAPVNPDNPDNPTVEKKRIYFMDRDWWNDQDAKTAFYYWDSTTDTPEYSWPGVTAFLLETIETDYESVVNVYYADIDVSKYDSIIFNRVSSKNQIEGALAEGTLKAQTADIKISDMGENNMVILTSPTEVLNTNGAVCETIFGVYEPGKWDFGQITGVYVPPVRPEGEITVYYRTTWSTCYAYAWIEGGDELATWPGVAMTPVADRTDGLYSIVIDAKYENIIFTDGAGNQTADLSMYGYTLETPFWSGSRWTEVPAEGENPDAPEIPEGDKIYFITASWWQADGATASFYAWGGGATFGWPGVVMHLEETLSDGRKVWSIAADVSVYDGFLFARTSGASEGQTGADWGAKTPDLTAASFGDNNCAVMTDDIVWGDPGVKLSFHTYVPGQTTY